VDVPRSLIDAALHVPTLLHKHSLGGLDNFGRFGGGDPI